jgi:hypothetical protein
VAAIHDLAAAWVIMDSRDKPGYDGWDEFTQTENALTKQKRSALRRSVFAELKLV